MISDKVSFKIIIYIDLNSHVAYKDTCMVIVFKPCVMVMVSNGIWWLVRKWTVCPNNISINYITFMKTKSNI